MQFLSVVLGLVCAFLSVIPVSCHFEYRISPTSPPTPAPTVKRGPVYFRLGNGSTVGACEVVEDGRCVTDGDGNYGDNEVCNYEVVRDAVIVSDQFQYEVEQGYDELSIDDTIVTKNSTIGSILREGTVMKWTSDYIISRKGYYVCASEHTLLSTSFPPMEIPTTSAPTVSMRPISPTSSPTPAPTNERGTAYFRLGNNSTVGACEVVEDGRCVTDGDGNYGNTEVCNYEVVRDAVIVSDQFQYKVEQGLDTVFDKLSIDGTTVTDSIVGSILMQGTIMTWTSDGSINYEGYYVCASKQETLAPSPAPTTDAGRAYFRLVTGSSTSCEVVEDGKCVTDGNGKYENEEVCVYEVLEHVMISGRNYAYDSEYGFDTLLLNDNDQELIPNATVDIVGLSLSAGDRLKWSSNANITEEGYYICASRAPAPRPWVL